MLHTPPTTLSTHTHTHTLNALSYLLKHFLLAGCRALFRRRVNLISVFRSSTPSHSLTSRSYPPGKSLPPRNQTNHLYVLLSNSSSSQVFLCRTISSFSFHCKYLRAAFSDRSLLVSVPLPCFTYLTELTTVWNYHFCLLIYSPYFPFSIWALGSLLSPAPSTVLTHSRHSLDMYSKSLKSWQSIPKLRCFSPSHFS